MNFNELSERFLVNDDVAAERLGGMIEKLLPFCTVRKDGAVDLVAGKLSGKNSVKLVLASRLVASKLKGSAVSEEVNTDEIGQFTGLPKSQAHARAKECVDERFAERSGRGIYKARQQMIDSFLAELFGTKLSKVRE
jgi:hypothetical protein